MKKTKDLEAPIVDDKPKATPIHNRAMLVSLRLSAWTARKYDKQISNKVAADHNAVQDAGRYNKMLLPGDCATYKALTQLVGSIRTEFYANTLAWSDEGMRLLPTMNFQTLAGMVRQWRAKFDSLKNDFLAEYPDLREAAKIRLNGMYKDSDYPTVSEIDHKFAFRFDVLPLPAVGDFRVDLPSAEIERIESEIQAKIADSVKDAMSDAWKRLYDAVKHIHERMSTPDAIFRDTLIYNTRELCDTLSRLNVTNDPDLEAFRDEIETYLAANDPDTLRDNEALREDTATLAEDIMSRMSAFYQE